MNKMGEQNLLFILGVFSLKFILIKIYMIDYQYDKCILFS